MNGWSIVNEEPMMVTWELLESAGGPMRIICRTAVQSMPIPKAIVVIIIAPGYFE